MEAKLIMLFCLLPLSLATDQEPRILAKYDTVIVERFDSEREIKNLPETAGLSLSLLTHERLKREGIFPKALHRSELPSDHPKEPKTLIIKGTIVSYAPGSRAARLIIGMGAGRAKIKIRFSLRDATTDEQITSSVYEGKFYGTFSAGAGNDEATMEAAGDVLDRLMEEIRKNR